MSLTGGRGHQPGSQLSCWPCGYGEPHRQNAIVPYSVRGLQEYPGGPLLAPPHPLIPVSLPLS